MVAPSSGSDDRRSSAGGNSRAEEQYIDLGGAEVTPQQEAAIRALIAGMNYSDAAAGVDRTTLYRWRMLDNEMAIATLKAQMAAKFRAHFGLPEDFPANREQLDLAASGALPDPATFDPRQVGWDYRNSASGTDENSKK